MFSKNKMISFLEYKSCNYYVHEKIAMSVWTFEIMFNLPALAVLGKIGFEHAVVRGHVWLFGRVEVRFRGGVVSGDARELVPGKEGVVANVQCVVQGVTDVGVHHGIKDGIEKADAVWADGVAIRVRHR